MARRLLLVQALLNYRTMQGGGYLFTLWPWVRRRNDRTESVRAVSGYVNSHPVFASFAVGAMRRRIEEGDLQDFAAWRESLAGPLGITGDSLIWDRWKPLIFAIGAWILLLFPSTPAWAIVGAACIILYNAPLYALRLSGIKSGYALGRQVLDALRDERYARWRRRLTAAGVFFSGALLGTAIHEGAQSDVLHGVQFLVAFAVMLWGLRFRLNAGTAALLGIVAALTFPLFAG